MWMEREIRRVASSQHGVLSRDQLLRLGTSDDEIFRRVAKGRLESKHAGVYYIDSTPTTWRTDLLAGVLAAGAEAVASHRAAAVLHGLDGVYGRTLEVTVPYDDSPEPSGLIVHRTRRPNDTTVVDGIPVTTPQKTVLDLASLLPDRVLWKAARSAIHKSLATVDQLDQAVAIFGGRGVGGTRRMRRINRLVAEDQSGSGAEIDLRAIVMDAPIPRPVQQLRIRLPRGSNAYPDFAWPDRMRIVEVDGFAAHGTPEQLDSDLRRQNQLLELGWQIRRFTADRVRDEPAIVRSEIIRFVNSPVL